MCTVLVTYDGNNEMAAQAMHEMSLINGVEINYHFEANSYKNGLDEAIEDIKMGRITKHKNFEEYKKAMREEFGYV